MIVFEQTLPFIIVFLAALTVLGVGLFSAWRYLPHSIEHAGLPVLFGVSLLVLFWCLLIPGRRDSSTLTIKPRFLVALDRSQSMTVRPNEEVETRWQKAMEALRLPWVASVAADADIELYPFSDELNDKHSVAECTSLVPDGLSTHLRGSLRELAGRYTGLNVAGVLLLSDGCDTREAFDDWVTDPLPFPLYTVRLEDDAAWVREPDVRVDTVVTARRVSSGWKSDLKAVVSGQGTAGLPLTVQLFKNDQLIDEKPTQIPAEGGQREVAFTLEHVDIGVFTYRIFVPPLPGEKQIEDNEYLVSISVSDPRDRLLYVEGVPRFEYRFLRRVLLANEQITPAIFYSGSDGSPHGGSPVGNLTADMTESDLLQFRIVILGNLSASELTNQRALNLVHFVETGGSLVLLGGTQGWGTSGFAATALQKVLPVRSHGARALETDVPFPVELTPQALAHPAFAGDAQLWAIVPPVLSVFPDVEPGPGAEVLLLAETPQGRQPIVVTQRYGQGRVAAIFTDSLWRWQLSPDTEQQQPYARFWTQLLSWMLPDADEENSHRIDLFAGQDQIHIGEKIELSARFPDPQMPTDAAVETRITQPDGRVVPYAMTARQVVTPGGRSYPGFALEYAAEVPGNYIAVAAYGTGPDAVNSDPVSFRVLAYSPETVPRPVKADLLQKLATSSGGRYFENLESLNKALANLRVSIIEEEHAEFKTLWRTWPFVVILMVLLSATWALRKYHHMP